MASESFTIELTPEMRVHLLHAERVTVEVPVGPTPLETLAARWGKLGGWLNLTTDVDPRGRWSSRGRCPHAGWEVTLSSPFHVMQRHHRAATLTEAVTSALATVALHEGGEE